nr:hypothetical protein [Pantoea cypripedii]
MSEFERFMAERFPDSIDRRRCLNGDGNDYMSWDMNVARVVWNHLRQKLDVLAAENSTLKKAVVEFNELYGQNLGVANWHQNGDVEPLDNFFEENDWNPETPVTDAYLNSVRAEGVEMFATAWEDGCLHTNTFVGGEAKQFAAQLRTAGQADKEGGDAQS